MKIKGRMRFKFPFFAGGESYVRTGDLQVLLNEASFRLKHNPEFGPEGAFAAYCIEQLLDAILLAEAAAR